MNDSIALRIAKALEDIADTLGEKREPTVATEITGKRVAELLAQYKRSEGRPPLERERPEHRACRRPI